MTKAKSTTQTPPNQGSIVANVSQQSLSGLTKGDLDKKADELTKKFTKNIQEVTNKFESRIEEKEAKTTEILAIFMTLFTFISVNVSIYTKVSDVFTAMVFMVIMTLCSTFLLSFILIVTNKHLPNRITTWGLLLSLLGLALIIILISITKWNPALNTS